MIGKKAAQMPYLAHACPVQLVDPALLGGDHCQLDRKHQQGGSAQHRVLDQHEGEQRQECPAVERRGDKGLTSKAADRFHLLHHDRNELRPSAGAAVATPAAVNREPQAADQDLANAALVHVQPVLCRPVRQQACKVQDAKNYQELDLAESDIVDPDNPALGADGVVDDVLRDLEGQVERRHRRAGDEQQNRLAKARSAEDQPEDAIVQADRMRTTQVFFGAPPAQPASIQSSA